MPLKFVKKILSAKKYIIENYKRFTLREMRMSNVDSFSSKRFEKFEISQTSSALPLDTTKILSSGFLFTFLCLL